VPSVFFRGWEPRKNTEGHGSREGEIKLELLHKEVTEQIIGAAIEVGKELGNGFLETGAQRFVY